MRLHRSIVGVGILLTELSNPLDCLPHNLFIAKQAVYGFENSSLFYKCLSKKSQMKNWFNKKEIWAKLIQEIICHKLFSEELMHWNRDWSKSSNVCILIIWSSFMVRTFEYLYVYCKGKLNKRRWYKKQIRTKAIIPLKMTQNQWTQQ